jgi:O-antigen/teichoic acid export membrane protein
MSKTTVMSLTSTIDRQPPRRLERGLLPVLAHRLAWSQLRVNVLSGFFSTGVNVVVMLISVPLYLHFLGYEKVGIWSLLASVQVFTQLGLLGVGPALTKLIAEERARGNSPGIQKYLSLATVLLLTTGAIAMAALLLFSRPVVHALGLRGADSEIALRLLPYVGLLTAFSFLNQVTLAALAGIGRMDVANYQVTLGKIVALALEATLLWRGWGVVTLLLGDLAGCAVIHIGGVIYLRSAKLRMIRGNPWDREKFSRLMSFGGAVLVSSLTILLIAPLNKLAISWFAGVALVPVFDIAVNGSMQLRSVAEVGLRALMPAVSHHDATGTADGRRQIRRVYFRALKFLLVVTPPAYLMALFADQPLLKLWLGHRFVPEIVPTLNILLGSAAVSLIGVPAYYTLMGTGRFRSCMVSHLLAAATNLVFIGGVVLLQGTCTLRAASIAVLLTNVVSTAYLMLQNQRVLREAMSDHARTDL